MRYPVRTLAFGLVSLLPLAAWAADAKPEPKGLEGTGLAVMDANNDGVVTHDEFISGSEARFKLMDANGDGKVTREELKNFRQKMREQREAKAKNGKEPTTVGGGGKGAPKVPVKP